MLVVRSLCFTMTRVPRRGLRARALHNYIRPLNAPTCSEPGCAVIAGLATFQERGQSRLVCPTHLTEAKERQRARRIAEGWIQCQITDCSNILPRKQITGRAYLCDAHASLAEREAPFNPRCAIGWCSLPAYCLSGPGRHTCPGHTRAGALVCCANKGCRRAYDLHYCENTLWCLAHFPAKPAT